jgi:hypothetical protein
MGGVPEARKQVAGGRVGDASARRRLAPASISPTLWRDRTVACSGQKQSEQKRSGVTDTHRALEPNPAPRYTPPGRYSDRSKSPRPNAPLLAFLTRNERFSGRLR